MKIKTPDQAKHHIESQGIKIIPGFPYNLYECGCVIRNDEDPQIYFHLESTRLRGCPHHKKRLLNKYKKCPCGREYLGKRLQLSQGCRECHNSYEYQKYYNENGPIFKEMRNSGKSDPSRWNCAHRDKCIVEFMKYDAIPCKGCEKYNPVSLDIDPCCAKGQSNDHILNYLQI